MVINKGVLAGYCNTKLCSLSFSFVRLWVSGYVYKHFYTISYIIDKTFLEIHLTVTNHVTLETREFTES